MKKHTLAVWACLIAAGLIGPGLRAADDPNVTIMKKLFTKIETVVGVGSNDPITGGSYLVLLNPGILVDPTLDLTKPQDQARLARMLDRVLTPTWIAHWKNERVVDVYQRILTYKEAPTIQPSAEQHTLLVAARALVFADPQKRVYTQEFKTFQDKRTALAKAVSDIETYRRANPDTDPPATLVDALQRADEDYRLIGNRNEMIAAKATIDTYEHLDPNVWWGELNDQFLTNTRTTGGQRFGVYDSYPSYKNWYSTTDDWTKLVTDQKALERTTSSSHASTSGGLSAGWGLWSVGGDYSHEENRTYFKLDVSQYTLSADLTTVILDRPWMTSAVFYSDAWRWLASAPDRNKLISDGTPVPTNPDVIMPYLPTGVLLARNVSLKGAWSADLKTTFDQKTSAGGSIGWGPFSFGGRTNTSDSNTYRKAVANGNELSFVSPQIIGFFVEVLPKSPNPNMSDYKWTQSRDTLTRTRTMESDQVLEKSQELLGVLQRDQGR
jgi:hypothetical protein